MGVIIGDEQAVAEFERNIKAQQDTIDEMVADMHGMAQEATSQISEEQRKAVEAIEKCAEALAKLSTKINELNEKKSDLNSKLSTIPPKIKKTYVDEDGKEYTVEEDNPEYINFQNQIILLQNQLQQLMNLSNQIDAVKGKLEQQSQILLKCLEQITQINESIDTCNISLGDISYEATRKLEQIQDVWQEYNTIRIDASSLASIDRKGVSVWEDSVPNAPVLEDTPKSAMQKMADYMSRHDYGIGDKDKYMQDPEWIALNAALQEDIKQREKDMERYLDVRIPKNIVFDTDAQDPQQDVFVKANGFDNMTSDFATIDTEDDDSNGNTMERGIKALEQSVRGEGKRGAIKTAVDYVIKWVVPFLKFISNAPATPVEHIELPDVPRTEQVIVEDSIDMSKKSIVGITEDGTAVKMDFDEDSNSYGVKISIDSEESDIKLKRALDELVDFLSDEYVKMYYDRKKREDEELAKKLGNPAE